MLKKTQDFSLKDKEGKKYSLKNFTSDFIVLYFYPKDDTPGCTIEAQEFTQDLDKFEGLNTIIIGISGGNKETKSKFCNKYNLKVLLLSDPDFLISKKYGVYGEKSFLGKKFMGIKRTTFILDKNRDIIKTYENVKPAGHSEEVLEFIKSKD
ncbi:MAG: Bacterioferritin comigratory protein [Parcubacteria group bacterium GW2011_GWA1_36_12]|nr:MAG: Bacterioferritin comigratory protein [Parcubacteria group bacterium GW2011_GWA1_36_12]